MAYNDATAKFSPPSSTLDASTSVNGILRPAIYAQPDLPAVSLRFGTGDGQINLVSKLYQATLAATPGTLDLTALVDNFGTAVNNARIKGLVFYNLSTTAATPLKVGANGTNPFAAMFGDVTDILMVPNGYLNSSGSIVPGFAIICAPAAAGLVTSGTSKVIKLDPGSATIPYAFAAFGVDA